jgi:hypothetical protein
MESIDIISVINKNGVQYGWLLAKTGNMLASGKFKLNWWAITTPKYRDVPKGFKKLLDLNPSSSVPGEMHGEGLMAGLEKATAKYVLFTDPDVAILQQDWDAKLVEKIQGNIVTVGFEYGGTWEKERYQKFPTITFMLSLTEVLQSLKIDLRQARGKLPTVRIRNPKSCSLFGVSRGKKMILETGWRLPFRLKRAGYEGHYMEKVSPFEKKKTQLPFAKEDVASYQPGTNKSRVRWMAKRIGNRMMHEFFLDGVLTATHMRYSRKYDIDHKAARPWFNKIRDHLKRTYNKKI